MFKERSTIYIMHNPYIFEGERNEDFPHLKSCPCEECAGVYERPVLDDEEEREKGRLRCTQDGCPGGKIRNPHTRRCIKVGGHIYDKVCTGG